jgi:SAM-dependent methyltransferase
MTKKRATRVTLSHRYRSQLYQSVDIYQSDSPILASYYWRRVTETIDMVYSCLDSPERAQVLDLGCGSGLALPTIQRYFGRVLAADVFTEQAAEVIKFERLPRVDLLAADGALLPVNARTFDVVFLLDVLEHVEGDKERILLECSRVLKKGGVIACSFPVEVGPAVVLRQLGRRVFGLEGNWQDPPEVVKHVFRLATTKATEGRRTGPNLDSDAHRGYDFKVDLASVSKYFEILDSRYIPFRHLSFLSPTFVCVGRKVEEQ